MKILGVGFLTDASACVLIDGKVVSAVSEERLNRIKQWHGIPRLAIEEALRIAGVKLDEIDLIATHGECATEPEAANFREKERLIRESDLEETVKKEQLAFLQWRLDREKFVMSTRTPNYLAEIRALGRPLKIYGHHQSHAACAYYGSGWDDCHVLTMDGWGEDGSSTLWRCKDGRMHLAARSAPIDSMGYFYGSITKALGFIPERHEGKVLGLAAYCRDPRSYKTIRSMIDYDPSRKSFVGRIEKGLYVPGFTNERLKELVRSYSREDIAASTQRSLEEVVLQCVRTLDPSVRRIALAGGVFANVKLNQRIREASNIDEVYVFPNMGDGGHSIGTAWLAHAEVTGQPPVTLTDVYLGPEYSDDAIGGALGASGLNYEKCSDIQKRTAGLLAANEVVILFRGRMEFGPRALCHRSVLYHATDPTVNQWLNDRLNRSEFMPFAPVTLDEDADRLYVDLKGGREAARYMTMTFDCTDEMLRLAPAAVHVDRTARPQIVSASDDAHMYGLLTEYKRLTGSGTVINTSYNMHEEPIVCSPDDALRAFRSSGLPYMAIGSFLVTNSNGSLK